MYKWCSTNANVIFVFLKNFRKDIFVYDFMLRDYIEGMFSFILFCKTNNKKAKIYIDIDIDIDMCVCIQYIYSFQT